jgi:hypothetical protein
MKGAILGAISVFWAADSQLQLSDYTAVKNVPSAFT